MAINYAKLFNRRVTPQSQPIPGSTQVRNSAGGYSWAVDDWTRFDRFLILGAEGGTYYITERDLVKQNHDAIVRCIKADGVRAVKRIVEISNSGRAPKNDPAIFALALACSAEETATRKLALAALPRALLPHPPTLGEQRLAQVRAEEPRASGHQHPLTHRTTVAEATIDSIAPTTSSPSAPGWVNGRPLP